MGSTFVEGPLTVTPKGKKGRDLEAIRDLFPCTHVSETKEAEVTEEKEEENSVPVNEAEVTETETKEAEVEEKDEENSVPVSGQFLTLLWKASFLEWFTSPEPTRDVVGEGSRKFGVLEPPRTSA
jgi:hypothetical protein